jgi:hypothetical protein
MTVAATGRRSRPPPRTARCSPRTKPLGKRFSTRGGGRMTVAAAGRPSRPTFWTARCCPRTKPLGERFSARAAAAPSPNEATWRMVLRTGNNGPVPERSQCQDMTARAVSQNEPIWQDGMVGQVATPLRYGGEVNSVERPPEMDRPAVSRPGTDAGCGDTAHRPASQVGAAERPAVRPLQTSQRTSMTINTT